MQNSLLEGVDHVVVAVSIEAIAAIIAGRRDANATLEHLMNHCHTAPAWRSTSHPILEIHVYGRKRDDGDFGLRKKVQSGDPPGRIGQSARLQQWPHTTRPL